MVLLERLSSNNFENFKTLNIERFSKENYDKNFFEYYQSEKFFLRIFLKKFVKLFVYGKKVIGYIWYEVPVEIPVRIWSLYVKPEYINLLTPNILNSFNNTVLSYETCEGEINNQTLINLGFNKVKPSILMNIKLNDYNKNIQVDKIKYNLENDYKLLKKVNSIYNSNIDKINITCQKSNIKKGWRASMWNSELYIFSYNKSPLRNSRYWNWYRARLLYWKFIFVYKNKWYCYWVWANNIQSWYVYCSQFWNNQRI